MTSASNSGGKAGLFWAANAARTLACALVVLVHVNLYARPGLDNFWPFGFLFVPCFSLAVPLFLIFSGYSAGRFSNDIRRPSISEFFFRKLSKLILPFFTWNAVMLFLFWKVEGRDLSGAESAFHFLTGAWQLYYLIVLVQLRLGYFLIERHLNGTGLYLFLAFSALLSAGFYGTADYVLWEYGAASSFFEDHLNRLMLPWALFFAIGVWLRHEKGATDLLFRKKFWLLGLSIISYLLYYEGLRIEEDWTGYNPLKQFLLAGLPFQVCAPLCVLIFLGGFRKSRLLRGLIRKLERTGKDTYAIYLSHTAALILLFNFLEGSVFYPAYWLEAPVLLLLVWALSLGSIRAFKMLGWRRLESVAFGSQMKRRNAA